MAQILISHTLLPSSNWAVFRARILLSWVQKATHLIQTQHSFAQTVPIVFQN